MADYRVQKMASNVGMDEDLRVLGDEWAPRDDTIEIIRQFIVPHLTYSMRVAEIGVGGGK